MFLDQYHAKREIKFSQRTFAKIEHLMWKFTNWIVVQANEMECWIRSRNNQSNPLIFRSICGCLVEKANTDFQPPTGKSYLFINLSIKKLKKKVSLATEPVNLERQSTIVMKNITKVLFHHFSRKFFSELASDGSHFLTL